jgi:hypothetical protein
MPCALIAKQTLKQLVVFEVKDLWARLRRSCCIYDELSEAEIRIKFPDPLQSDEHFMDSVGIAHGVLGDA